MSNARNLARLLPNASGQLPDAAMASGSVLQVVQTAYGGTETYISGVAIVTALSASITPQSANSKILVLGSCHGKFDPANNEYSFGERLLRNGVQVQVNPERFYGNVAFSQFLQWPFIFLDSPATTSAISYQYQITSNNRGGLAYNRGGSTGSTFTLIEVA